MDKTLEVLVVDDKEENIKAAGEYFSRRDDVKVDFAMNYNEALRKLEENVYAIAIFDLELPRNHGEKTEKLGFELAREATKYAIPWAVITSGIGHHNKGIIAFVSYSWEGIRDVNERLTEVGFPKTDPRSWQEVYETLIEDTPTIIETFEAKKRYKNNVGRQFQLDPVIAEALVPGFKKDD